jgi:adenylosuccinate lyase
MRAAAVAGIPGMSNPYERLKGLSRGHNLTPSDLHEFIVGLGLPQDTEDRLLALTPATYTGLANELVQKFLSD